MIEEQTSRDDGPSGASASPPANPALHCLGGDPIPDAVMSAWRVFEGLPESARNQIWEVLVPLIVKGIDEEVSEISGNWCQTYGVRPEDLEKSIEACHFFVAQAARLNLEESKVREDVEAISVDGQPGLKALMTHFTEMRKFVRERILEGSLLDHGKVFTGLDWRLDMVGASDRGLKLELPIALLTLRHQEGCDDQAEKGKTSLYLTPEAISELRRVCEQLEEMFEAVARRTTK